jgi:Rrf2 family protein
MLKFSSKIKYAIIAIIELAEKYERELVQITDIVKHRKVPKNYMEQILNRLSKHGIVKSVRGNKGGYKLTKDPANLKLLEIIESLEGEIKLIDDVGLSAFEEIVYSIEDDIKNKLNISITDLMVLQKKYEANLMYHI